MVKSYRKGYMAEWSLTHELSKKGYMVVRTPRSGRIGLASPDIIAAKKGRLIVIECKSRKSAFNVPLEQLEELKEWEEKAGAKSYVAWKIPRKGWFFLHLEDVINNKGNIGKKFVIEKAINMDSI
jgi:Holliday junction resolvase